MKMINTFFDLHMGFVRAAGGIALLAAVAGCGGGGGDGGTSNTAAIANRYTVNLGTRPSTSVFFNGASTTAYVTLVKNCSDAATTSSTTTPTGPLITSCGGTQPIDSVAGQAVTLSSSDPSAITF